MKRGRRLWGRADGHGRLGRARSRWLLTASVCLASTACSSDRNEPPYEPSRPAGLPAGVDSPASGESPELLAIGRVAGCSAAVIDVGGDDDSPAYVLSAGHCLGGEFWEPNIVYTDVTDSPLEEVSVNGFWDTYHSPIDLPIERVDYATMHSLDVSIIRLKASVGELRAQGITPLLVAEELPVVGAPITVVGHPASWVMMRSHCHEGRSTRIAESDWLSTVVANDCAGVSNGSSGAPVMDEAGRVFAVVATGPSTPGAPCSLNNPCDLEPVAEEPPVTTYAAPLAGLRGCFASGVFDLSRDACPLPRPPLPNLERGIGRYFGQSAEGATPHWDASLEAGFDYYRFKAGSAAITHCEEEEGYGEVTSVAAAPVIEAELARTPGLQVLCVHAGTGESLSTFTPLSSTAALLAELDQTPPPLPLPVTFDMRSGIGFSVSLPDYAKFYYRLQRAGQRDCVRLPDDGVITMSVSLIPLERPTGPLELCVTAEDGVGNLTEPQVITPGAPSPL